MKRHLTWIIAGCATLTLAVPAFAAARDAGTPDDNGVPGEVRGNCDEAEHAADPECVSLAAATTSAPSTSAPSTSAPSTSAPSANAPANSVPSASTTSMPDDVSGPCDEAEHADDPRCTGAIAPSDDDRSGHDDDADEIDNDDRSGHTDDTDDDTVADDDDRSGHTDDTVDDDDDDDDDRSGPGDGDEVDDDDSGRGGDDD
jgi:hypothetical protein